MKLEDMLSQANELFGVNLDALNTRISEQVIRACLENIETAFQKVQEPNVAKQFALANMSLGVVNDYGFLISEYEELAEFSQQFDALTQVNTTELLLEGLQKHKVALKEVEQRYKEVKKDTTGIKKKAIEIALGTIGEYFELLDKTTKEINRKSVTGVVKEDKKRIDEELKDKGLTARVGAGTDSAQKTRIKGKSALCFEINGQEYYRINDIADMFGTTKSALQQHLSISVEEKERARLKKEGKERAIVYNGKRSNVYSVLAFETILPKKYRSVIKDTLAKFTPTPASQEEYNVVGEERSIDTVIERRSKVEKVVRRDEGERVEQPVSQVPQVDDSDVVINYFVYRGKNYYTGPNAAKVLGVKYSQMYQIINTKSVKDLIDLETLGKLKVFKREKGMALKTYREDILLDLVPEKLRKGIDVQKRLKKLNTEEYEGKYKAITLAETGVSVDGYRPQPSTTQNGDNGVAAKARPRLIEAPEKAERRVGRTIRTKETSAPPVEQQETPEAFKSPLPENLKEILSVEGLEQTIEGAETLYFLAINGQRYFPMSELKSVYENKEYDGRAVNPNVFSVYISQRSKQGKFPDGSLLKLKVLKGFQGRKSEIETYFIREDVVQVAIPDYVTDNFSELATGHSMQQFPFEYIDTETIVGEIKKYGLDKTSDKKQKKNGRRKSKGDVDSNPDASLEKRVETHEEEGSTEEGTEQGEQGGVDVSHNEEVIFMSYFTIGGAKYFKLKDVASLELTQPKMDEFEKKGVIRYVVSVGKPMKGGAGTHRTPVIHEEYIPEVLDEETRKRFSEVFVKISKQEISISTYMVTDRNKQPVQVTTALVDIEVPSQGSAQEVTEKMGSDTKKGGAVAADTGDIDSGIVGVSKSLPRTTQTPLERTVDDEEGRLYFLDVQGRRYFPVLSIHAVFSGKKYENVNITDPGLYLKIINKRIKKQQVPNDACLMVNVISGPEDEPISGAQWFVDEAYVKEAVLPNSITIRFKDAIERYSLKTYPMDKINRESLAVEMKRCGLAQEGELISYDELPTILDSDMDTIDVVCKGLEQDGKIQFIYTELGTDGPKLLDPKYLSRVAHVLQKTERMASEMLRT